MSDFQATASRPPADSPCTPFLSGRRIVLRRGLDFGGRKHLCACALTVSPHSSLARSPFGLPFPVFLAPPFPSLPTLFFFPGSSPPCPSPHPLGSYRPRYPLKPIHPRSRLPWVDGRCVSPVFCRRDLAVAFRPYDSLFLPSGRLAPPLLHFPLSDHSISFGMVPQPVFTVRPLRALFRAPAARAPPQCFSRPSSPF